MTAAHYILDLRMSLVTDVYVRRKKRCIEQDGCTGVVGTSRGRVTFWGRCEAAAGQLLEAK